MPEGKNVQCYPPAPDDFLSPDALAELTPQSIIERMRALTGPLRAGARQAEEQRRPIDELWDEIRASGYFYMLVPKAYGGLEASIDEIVDATLPIAEGCASTAWVAIFGLVHNRHMVAFPKAFQDELFGGGRYGIIATGTVPMGQAKHVDGGFVLNGLWKWSTCLTQADWVMLLAETEVDGQKTAGSFMVPVGDVLSIDTWTTDGMRATGTHDVAVADLFVPEHRVNLVQGRDGSGRGAQLYDNPIYRVPLSPLLAFTTAVPVVGAAKAAVELYRERLSKHVKRGTEGSQSDKQASQIRLARADTMVAVAEATVRQAMKDNLKGIELDGDEQVVFRSKLRAQMTFAAQLCRQAVQIVCESTGTSIHYLDNPLQRIWRDMMVMTSHIIFDDDVTMEQHGRGMLGLPPTTAIN
ncbi:acyl-CoA dehydrogenase family protein [Sphingopyxis lindanitolerans]|nr:acyl-CoA dehydrogenase family protein [Sphingopyxis lindanitolerans]